MFRIVADLPCTAVVQVLCQLGWEPSRTMIVGADSMKTCLLWNHLDDYDITRREPSERVSLVTMADCVYRLNENKTTIQQIYYFEIHHRMPPKKQAHAEKPQHRRFLLSKVLFKKTGSQSIQPQPQLNASSLLILITPPRFLVNFNIWAGGGEQMAKDLFKEQVHHSKVKPVEQVYLHRWGFSSFDRLIGCSSDSCSFLFCCLHSSSLRRNTAGHSISCFLIFDRRHVEFGLLWGFCHE